MNFLYYIREIVECKKVKKLNSKSRFLISGFPNNLSKMMKNTRSKKPPAKTESPKVSSPQKSAKKEPEIEPAQNKVKFLPFKLIS